MSLILSNDYTAPFVPNDYFCHKFLPQKIHEFWSEEAYDLSSWNTFSWAVVTFCNFLYQINYPQFNQVCQTNKNYWIKYIAYLDKIYLKIAKWYLTVHGLYCNESLHPDLCRKIVIVRYGLPPSMLSLPHYNEFVDELSSKNINEYELAPYKFIKYYENFKDKPILVFDRIRDISHNSGTFAEYMGQSVFKYGDMYRGYYTAENYKEFISSNIKRFGYKVFFDLVEPIANSFINCVVRK